MREKCDEVHIIDKGTIETGIDNAIDIAPFSLQGVYVFSFGDKPVSDFVTVADRIAILRLSKSRNLRKSDYCPESRAWLLAQYP